MFDLGFEDVYQIGPELSRGGFGVVCSGQRKLDGLLVAIKFVKFRGPELPIPKEIRLLELCRGSHGVIKILDWFKGPSEYIIVMESPLESCDLLHYITINGPLCEVLARNLFRQIVEGIMFCFRKGVLYRDLKAENLLLDPANMKIKLIEFGNGTFVEGGDYNDYAGTRGYMPPECLKSHIHNGIQGIVWSLGILLYQIVCGHLPFEKDDEILLGIIKWYQPISKECMNIIERCLALEESTRPTLASVLEHTWVKGEKSLENECQGPEVEDQNSKEVEKNAQKTVKKSETRQSVCAWLMSYF